jgi:hypothetical protein
MTIYTQMLAKQPVEEFESEESESNIQDNGKTVKTSYLTFHDDFENVCKRQKISDDSQGKN